MPRLTSLVQRNWGRLLEALTLLPPGGLREVREGVLEGGGEACPGQLQVWRLLSHPLPPPVSSRAQHTHPGLPPHQPQPAVHNRRTAVRDRLGQVGQEPPGVRARPGEQER